MALKETTWSNEESFESFVEEAKTRGLSEQDCVRIIKRNVISKQKMLTKNQQNLMLTKIQQMLIVVENEFFFIV